MKAGHQKFNVTKDQLEDLYWKEGLSSSQIGKRLGIAQVTINRYLRNFRLSDRNRRGDQTGEANHNFKGGMSRSTLGRTTKQLCEDAGVKLNVCQMCNTTWSGNLDRHHIDRDKSNNTISNILVICPSCHAKTHAFERARDQGRFA